MTDAPPSTLFADQSAYTEAVQLALDAAAAYYADGTSTLDDDAYDRLVRGIQAYEAEHPDEVLPSSPTGKVAGGAVVGDVPHTVPMLSLDNVFSAEKLVDWAASLERRLGRPVTAWSVEPKLDGLAIAARYRDGRLTQLVTRGDGTKGEDVSHAIGTIVGLPANLAEPVTVELRGEVMMTTSQFEDACAKRQAHDGTTFANPRSAAAGTLRAQDRPYMCELTFFGYGALPHPDDASEQAARLRELPHSEVMAWVAVQGVQTTAATPVAGIVATTLEVRSALTRVEKADEDPEHAGRRRGAGNVPDGMRLDRRSRRRTGGEPVLRGTDEPERRTSLRVAGAEGGREPPERRPDVRHRHRRPQIARWAGGAGRGLGR
jgi:DNA ligase (NAD+)